MRFLANMSAKGPFSVVLATDPLGDLNIREAVTESTFKTIDTAMSAVEKVWKEACARGMDVVDVHVRDVSGDIVGGISFEDEGDPDLEITGAEEWKPWVCPECGGTGRNQHDFAFPCQYCGGS